MHSTKIEKTIRQNEKESAKQLNALIFGNSFCITAAKPRTTTAAPSSAMKIMPKFCA